MRDQIRNDSVLYLKVVNNGNIKLFLFLKKEEVHSNIVMANAVLDLDTSCDV